MYTKLTLARRLRTNTPRSRYVGLAVTSRRDRILCEKNLGKDGFTVFFMELFESVSLDARTAISEPEAAG